MHIFKIISLSFILLATSQFSFAENDVKGETEEQKSNQLLPNTTNLTKADFLKLVFDYETNPNEWKYLGDKPAIIDFTATWCGPCKILSPILEELGAEYKGKITIYKIDIDKEQELAAAFGVRSIPTLIFIPMGEQPQISQGLLSKETLVEAINNVLLKKEIKK